MNHPSELLAGLVDGTLDEEDLAEVHAHLDACASCRHDVADALVGTEALRSLPLEEPPSDLHRRVMEAGGGRGAPSWYRWAGTAAAAVVVLAIAIALPNVGGGSRDLEAVNDAAGQPEVSPPQGAESAGGGVVVEDKDYSAEGLEALARSVIQAPEQTFATDATARDSDAAVRCVSRAIEHQPLGRLTRLIQARFEGEEAYIAVYLEGPGAQQEPDLVNVLAASRRDCSLLSLAYDTP